MVPVGRRNSKRSRPPPLRLDRVGVGSVTTRVVQLPVYALVIGVATALVSPPLATIASVRIAEGNAAAISAGQVARDEALREERRLQSCELFGSLLDVYDETPPSTPAGRNVEQAYRDYYNDVLRCTPERRTR